MKGIEKPYARNTGNPPGRPPAETEPSEGPRLHHGCFSGFWWFQIIRKLAGLENDSELQRVADALVPRLTKVDRKRADEEVERIKTFSPEQLDQWAESLIAADPAAERVHDQLLEYASREVRQ